MARLCVLLCQVEDEEKPDELTQLSRIDLPPVDPQELAPPTALDQLEGRAVRSGQEVIRRLLRHQWEALDQELTAAAQRLSPPGNPATGRG
jgi:hypothetical protein